MDNSEKLTTLDTQDEDIEKKHNTRQEIKETKKTEPTKKSGMKPGARE